MTEQILSIGDRVKIGPEPYCTESGGYVAPEAADATGTILSGPDEDGNYAVVIDGTDHGYGALEQYIHGAHLTKADGE